VPFLVFVCARMSRILIIEIERFHIFGNSNFLLLNLKKGHLTKSSQFTGLWAELTLRVKFQILEIFNDP